MVCFTIKNSVKFSESNQCSKFDMKLGLKVPDMKIVKFANTIYPDLLVLYKMHHWINCIDLSGD